jgi:hypothetical protein
MADPNTPINREDVLKELKEINDLLEQNKKLDEDQIKRRQELLIILENFVSNFDQLIAQQKLQLKVDSEIYGQNSATVKLREIELETLRQQRQLQEAVKKGKVDEIIQISKTIQLLKSEAQSISSSIGDAANIGKLLGIDPSKRDTLAFKLLSDSKGVFSGFKDGTKNVIESVGGAAAAKAMLVMKLGDALSSVGSKIIEIYKQQVTALDTARTSFIRLTGASTNYNSIIANVGQNNRILGIGFAEAGEAATALYQNLNTFTTLSKDTQEQLVLTSAKLAKLGVNGQESAKFIASLSVTMGITEKQAADTALEFAALGQKIGVTSSKMISDFNSVKSSISVFGENTKQVFINLEAQAKATGVAITDLTTLAGKFDTFEGAATQVGKLNAILGGPFLSAMSMIEATDPTERINMLRQAVNNAGISFEQMSYYQKKAIAEAGGFKDVDEAQRLLSMSAGQAAEELQKQQASQEELNKTLARAQSVQEKMNMAMANMAILVEPLVNLVSNFASTLVEYTDEAASPFMSIIIKISGAFVALISLFGSLVTAITVAKIAWIIFSAVFAGSGVGTIIVGVALAISALVTAIMFLHDWLLEPHSLPLKDALEQMPIIFKSIGDAVSTIIGSIRDLALAFAQLNLATAANLYLIAGGIMAITYAMVASIGGGIMNKFASFFGVDLISQIKAFGEAVNEIDKDNLVNFKVVLEKIVEVTEPQTLSGFQKFSEKFELAAKATAQINANNTQALTNMLVATQNVSQVLAMKQTVIVKIGNKEIEGMIDERIDATKPRTANQNTVIA